jgi:flagellar basal body-associated protein FliL
MNLEETKAKAKSIGKKMAIILIVLSILTSVGYYMYRTWNLSDGTRTGVLFKISKKGVFFKTYEGQIHLGGSNIMSNQSVWDFSAKDESVYGEIQKFEGKNVKLHYKQLVDPFPWQGDTEYIVYKAEAVQ